VVNTGVDAASAAVDAPRDNADERESWSGVNERGQHLQWAARVTLAWASVAASVAVADLRGDVDAESAILGNATVIGEDEVGGGVHEITASSSAKEASAPTRNGSGLVRVVKTGLGHADGVDVIGEVNARGKLEERHVVHDQLGVVARVVSHANNTNANHPGFLVDTIQVAELCVVESWIWVGKAVGSSGGILVSDQRAAAEE